jgi:transcriptional regulator with XRE-family HTH domain
VETLGTLIEPVRKSPGPSQEHLPEQIGTIQSYISDIQQSEKIPSEKLIKATACGWGYKPALDLAEWLDRNPEFRELAVEWARARMNGSLSNVAADLLEVRTKAEARYLLQGVPKGVDATRG